MASPLTLRRALRSAKLAYETIKLNDPGTDVPLEEQHRFWRLHDTAKQTYAILDWRYESAVLRITIALTALLSFAAVAWPVLGPIASLACALALLRVFLVLTRLAPE